MRVCTSEPQVSTNDTSDHGWETMVFDDAQPGIYAHYAIDIRRYRNAKEAYVGHVEMVRKWATKPWWKTAKSYGREELPRRASSNRREGATAVATRRVLIGTSSSPASRERRRLP